MLYRFEIFSPSPEFLKVMEVDEARLSRFDLDHDQDYRSWQLLEHLTREGLG